MLPPHVQRQIAEMEAEKKRAKEEKKQAKKQGKRAPSPTFDPKKEEDLDRAAAELAMKLAARMDMGEWKPPSEREKEEKEKAETPIKTEMSVRVDNISVKDDTSHKSSIAVSEDLPPLSAKSGRIYHFRKNNIAEFSF
jgi:sRNA-binding protein